ncbi:CRISPR-associated Cas1 family protein [Halanaerobium saccharolyticum]|jgi:CRISPR-associated protein Cas1|uniref:CRISPR-associated endonuclease Cas1 n=1 Tax=Halanaerobium saccharolyticum TaxID=43595 RepID=A0A4R6RWM8_9FIRM|nr:type I-C CRISPR-associated endonuclease Cas1c [Halanaerobium saccharolyticum]TDP91214.1 CRISPR-associated Cas1 family protein [Halanaerobium saccharolyticum]
MAHHIKNTLYITNPESYLRKKHDVIIVEVEKKEKIRIPGHHLGSIILFGRSKISHYALDWCIKNGVAVTRVTRSGRYIGNWSGPVKGNVLLRVEQFDKYKNEDEKCKLSQSFIKGKIYNQRSMLLRSARDIDDEELEKSLRKNAAKLDKILNIIDDSDSVDQVRGFEGIAAKNYFSVFDHMIINENDIFKFKKRTKRPPRDVINAMLSYLYVILNHDCRTALEAVGLDPQIGFLHEIRPGKPALALDLMEELRPIMVERLVLTMINRKQVNKDDFEFKAGGAVEMKEDFRKKLIQQYQEKKQNEIKHPLLDRVIPYGLIPFIQARLLARRLRGDVEEYPPFIYQ